MAFTRRDVLKLAAAGSLSGLAGCASTKVDMAQTPKPAPSRMPVVFISHGSPMVALIQDDYHAALKKLGEEFPFPKAVVVVSAHWQEEEPIRVTAGERPATIHDFGGFPEKLHKMVYPSPGHPELAAEIATSLTAGGFPARLEDRGLDHGAWIPMRIMYPGADVPVIEITLRYDMAPKDYLKLGAVLAPLRERGVLIVGSGGIVHSFPEMRRLKPGESADAWAVDFDTWLRERLDKRDIESVLNYRTAHPSGARSAPTTEHFDPVFVTLGASDASDRVVDVYEGFRGANLSMRTFALKS